MRGSIAAGADGKMAYIDLFAGPGRYDDGAISTPLMLLKYAIKKPELQKNLITLFNDKKRASADSLKSEIGKLPGIEKLSNQPTVISEEVNENSTRHFSGMGRIPYFTFLDPWGYKGISLELIQSATRNAGCDCLFFFNYKRINAAVSNEIFAENMSKIFGEDRAKRLQEAVEHLMPRAREVKVIEEMILALKEMD